MTRSAVLPGGNVGPRLTLPMGGRVCNTCNYKNGFKCLNRIAMNNPSGAHPGSGATLGLPHLAGNMPTGIKSYIAVPHHG